MMIENDKLGRLLNAVSDITAKVTDCWVITASADGDVNARIVAPIPRAKGDDDWTFCIATSGTSRKAQEIRSSGRLTLGYQHHPTRAYVALQGTAEVVGDRAQVRARWNDAWRLFFPGGPDDPATTLVRFNAERIECCIPGLTPEPFGSRYAVLERDADGLWRVTSG